MWNWFTKMLGRHEQPKRKKVQVEIPFEQHRFSMDDFSYTRLKFDTDANLPQQDAVNLDGSQQEVDAGNKSS